MMPPWPAGAPSDHRLPRLQHDDFVANDLYVKVKRNDRFWYQLDYGRPGRNPSVEWGWVNNPHIP